MPQPGVVDDQAAFAAFVAGLPAGVAEIVRAADALVRSVDPAVTQVLWAHQRTVGYGIGPKKLSEHYAYLDVYDAHVNLGFNRGAGLPDPGGLLEGTGARFRKTRLGAPADVEAPPLQGLLAAAMADRRTALGR